MWANEMLRGAHCMSIGMRNVTWCSLYEHRYENGSGINARLSGKLFKSLLYQILGVVCGDDDN